LKTLEEPPAHVKFIFATTEIRKVPVTILSRCQRFDLRRLDEKEIASHLKNILVKENFEAEELGLTLIAKVSEGSVRDSLSLLDQALANNNHQKFLSADLIEKMLGLNDKTKILELFSALLRGDFSESSQIFNEFYSRSSDVLQLLQDLLAITHKTTSAKLLKDYKLDDCSKFQQDKIHEIAKEISLNSLTRIWQMLVKGASEITFSSSPKMMFEMLMMRICYLAALPDLKQVLLIVDGDKNPQKKNQEKNIDQKIDENNDELINDILRSFEGSKLI
jgi:DNA polymerase-3 subunit gamma/tau